MEEMNDKLQVLLIEDNANYAGAIREVLASVWDTPFELEWADQLSTGLELLAVGGVDAILLDLVLPDSQGFETFATVHTQAPDVPIIVMSGLGDEALAVRAVREGAQDYLDKGQVDVDVLVRAIRYAIERKRAEKALHQAHTELESRVQERTRDLASANEALRAEIAERKQAETALKRSWDQIERAKHEWEATADALPQFVCLLDDQKRILRANRTVERWGLAEVAENKGWEIHELVHPGCTDSSCYLDAFWHHAWENVAHGRSAECEADDRILKRHIHIQVRPILTQEGRAPETAASFAAVVIHDITERKQAEQALREAEMRYRTVADFTFDWEYWENPDGTLRYVSPACERITGYAVNEFIENPDLVSELVLSQDEEIWIEHRRAVVETPEPREVQFRIRRRDGETRWIEQACQPVIDEQEVFLGYRASNRDVTGRKQAEEMIVHRNKELVALYTIASTINQSPDLDHILDATLGKVLEVIEVDAGWIQLLDESASVLLLATQRGFSQEMTREMKTVKLEESITGQVAQSGRPIVADAALLTTTENPWSSLGIDKRDSMYTFASVPIESRGQVLGVLSILSHSSRLMSTQQIQLLIAIGHQIGVAIENTRLIEETAEVEILQELGRLRSELVANVSHELRTPLGLIKLCSSALLEKDVDFDPETQQQFLQSIDEEADRLEVIVNNLLNLSRLEGGQLRLVRRPTEIDQLVSGVIESMEIQFPQHHLVCDFPSEPLIANVDSGYVEQVLRNLLTNAVKYSPAGGTITVQGQGDQWRVLISVSDQGIGIPPEDLERVFERFYRVENEVTQDVSGAGLGLTVCQGIVEAHGGRIWVESTPGEGSTFYITLKRDVGDVNGNAQIANGYRGDEV